MAAEVLKSSEGGVTATHPQLGERVLLAGPATGDERNTFRRRIAPIACWRVEDMRFDFDSSFVLPDMKPELRDLADLVDRVRQSHPGDPPASLSVFGHADPTGDDDYNKKLSGRRAQAVCAMLIRDADLWEDLYSHPQGGDNWQTRALPVMTAETGVSAGWSRESRKQLFLAYMDALCTRADGSPFRLQRTDFLGNGADAGGKADYQGCSEFNSVLVFSADERKELDKTANHAQRNAENAPNRRVVVFVFRAGLRVAPGRWPCGRASDGAGPCKKRFWSDGELRRSNQAERREFKNTRDTFACRFYHRMASESPCEGVVPVILPGAAQWDRPKVSDGETARMLLTAPDLGAGQPVVFEVIQESYGKIGEKAAVAGAGQASAEWNDWFHPKRVNYQVALKPGVPFPPVNFSFNAIVGGRVTPAAVPLVYEDFLKLQVTYEIDGQTKIVADARDYAICSPWGTRTGKTDKNGWISEEKLPPGGASVILGKKTLLTT
jgi:hypothetical protein